MKKITLFLAALAISLGMSAQCPLTQAVDFTATDFHGNEIHLFEILDRGQYVLIDFFFTTCGPCQQAAPKMVEAYQRLGCNMHDVFFVEIDTGDGVGAVQNWINNYAVEYPTIVGSEGGTSICNTYQIQYYPTVILIAPNRDIVERDIYPIPNSQTVVNTLAPYGIEEHDCNGPVAYDAQVSITVDQIGETEVTATFTPNEDCAMYYYTLATEAEIQQWMSVAGMELPEYLQNYGFPADDVISHTFTDLTANTEYGIFAVPQDPDGNLHEVVQEYVTTTSGVVIDTIVNFSGTDLNGNEIRLYDILDAGQAVLINFFLTDDPFSAQPMTYLTESYKLFGCNENDVFFMGISPNGHDDDCAAWVETYNVEYPTISRDGGGNAIVQAIPVGYYPTVMIIRPDHTFAYRDLYPLENTQTIVNALESEGYEQHECATGVTEENETLSLYPNPANDFVTLLGENLGMVHIYNALGQEVECFITKSDELRINTTHFEDGVYLIKTDNQTVRFVVKH